MPNTAPTNPVADPKTEKRVRGLSDADLVIQTNLDAQRLAASAAPATSMPAVLETTLDAERREWHRRQR